MREKRYELPNLLQPDREILQQVALRCAHTEQQLEEQYMKK